MSSHDAADAKVRGHRKHDVAVEPGQLVDAAPIARYTDGVAFVGNHVEAEERQHMDIQVVSGRALLTDDELAGALVKQDAVGADVVVREPRRASQVVTEPSDIRGVCGVIEVDNGQSSVRH